MGPGLSVPSRADARDHVTNGRENVLTEDSVYGELPVASPGTAPDVGKVWMLI